VTVSAVLRSHTGATSKRWAVLIMRHECMHSSRAAQSHRANACRVVQRSNQPIILTGFQALNKLLGRPVYTSQLQLGGPRVMSANGVAHLTVDDDLLGVRAVLEWLAFTPLSAGAPPAIHEVSMRTSKDSGRRRIAYRPPSGRFDVRDAAAGMELAGEWVSGMFDRGSWREYHRGWARTVITGRARLEGLPVGVLGVERDTVTVSVPADPGMPTSSEQEIVQAGQVRMRLQGPCTRACSLMRIAALRCSRAHRRVSEHAALQQWCTL
jgi:acetyl-CoA carboxylase carboxyltransferase component